MNEGGSRQQISIWPHKEEREGAAREAGDAAQPGAGAWKKLLSVPDPTAQPTASGAAASEKYY